MSGGLLLAIGGLALVDSLNPATIISVILILLGAQRRPGLTALATVSGAALTVFTLGAALFLTASAAAGVVDGLLLVVRITVFAVGGLGLIVLGIRRFRPRERKPVRLPSWFTAWTAFPFGVAITGADLPNAFPYFVAIERLVDANATTLEGLLVIGAYSVVYCLPCLILLVVGLLTLKRTRAFLTRVTERFGTGVAPASVRGGIIMIVLGLIVLTIPVWLLT